jgi:hypothetical protein
MNEQPLYDTLIAAKLEQLPVPDMADAIWLRIKDQLDTDMPSGDHNPPPPAPPRGGRTGWRRWSLLAAVAVLFLIYTLNKQQHHQSPQQQIPGAVMRDTTSIAPRSVIKQPPGEKPKTGSSSTPVQQDSLPGNVPAPMQDNTVPVLPAADSITLPPPAPVINQAPPSKPKDSLPARKPRGVQGIKESDYKIIPKQQPN